MTIQTKQDLKIGVAMLLNCPFLFTIHNMVFSPNYREAPFKICERFKDFIANVTIVLKSVIFIVFIDFKNYLKTHIAK